MISVKCNIILGIFFLLVVESVTIKPSQSAYPTLRPPPLPDLPDPEEDTFPTLDGQSRAASSQTMPRVDNRNYFDFHPIPVARPKRCNKRIRIANGVTRFRERGTMVRYACSHGFTLIGAPLAVCLRDQWSEPPPICTRPGCRRILTPSNGLARLLYAGAVVAFFCESQYNLEGSRVLFCDGNRWNATEPVCIPKDPPTTTEVWEWPAQRLGESDDESESWDYNNPDAATSENPIANTTDKLEATSPKVTQQSASTTKTKPEPAILVTEAENATMPMLKTTPLPHHRLETTLNMPETTEKTSMKSFPSSTSTTQRPTIPTTTTSKHVILTTMVTSTKRSTTQQTTPTKTRSRTTKTPTITTTSSTTTTTTTTAPIFTSETIPDQSHEVIYVNVPDSKTTTESWEPFPGHTFTTFDEGLIYESATPAPEFIQPLKPISPDKLNDDEYYKKVAHLSIVGGIVLGSLGIIFFVGGVATYCWRKNIGIARANAYDIDGRTLSASEANDDFTWMDPIRDPTHTDSRL